MNVGILGGGQLALMMVQAGKDLGISFEIFSPEPFSPAGRLAKETVGSFTDKSLIQSFFQRNDIVTYEWENLPVELLKEASTHHSLLFPSADILQIISDRFRQKKFLESLGIPVAPTVYVSAEAELSAAVNQIGVPGLFKTNRFGYDGKGQKRVGSLKELDSAWKELGQVPLVYEKWIPFERELSLVACRDRRGEMIFYPLVENIHEEGILSLTLAPAEKISSEMQKIAESYAVKVCQCVDYVGVLVLELFQVGELLLVNEMASRVHNTGHWSIEGALTSQFENHLRAGLGLTLGQASTKGCSAMLNLIGDLPEHLDEIRGEKGVFIHLYGKSAKPGRKLGHITMVSRNSSDLRILLTSVKSRCGL